MTTTVKKDGESVNTTALTIDSILASGDEKIHLPPPLIANLPEAAKVLIQIDQEARKTVNFTESFPGFHPGDAGVCFMRLLKDRFGFVSMHGAGGFFGPRPPMLLNIRTGVKPTDVEQMVFGEIQVPGLGSSVKMSIGINFNTRLPCLYISGSCENRHLAAAQTVLADLKRELPRRSIYRGKAIRVSWAWQRKGEEYSLEEHAPTFLDLSRCSYDKIVLNEDASRQVAANLFMPITCWSQWQEHGFARKSGVLMQGPPGCGKTETLLKVANLCAEHERTYIQCESVEDLEPATHMALNYQPCVVAVEDIDKAVSGDRSKDIDKILNIIDGTETKNQAILFVATTNDVASITDAMLRPGRLGDGFIHMGPPDEVAVERLIRLTAGAALHKHQDIKALCQKVAGARTIPAVIVATVQSARKYALARTVMSSDQVTAEDLEAAFGERVGQLKLLTKEKPDTRSEMVKAADIVAGALGSLGAKKEDGELQLT